MIRTRENRGLGTETFTSATLSSNPKLTGMGSNTNLRVGLRKSRGISLCV